MHEKILEALNKIRPSLQADGGDVELVSVDEKSGIVQVRLTGHCVHCPMAQKTLKQGIEVYLKKEVPGVKIIEAA